MTRKRKSKPNPESAESLGFLLDGFDYRIECDDFLLYELGRLIEEDRASFDDDQFRHLIDEGIREHVEHRLALRAEIAMHIRSAHPHLDERTREAASHVLHAVEDIESVLRDIGLIVRTYTTFLFRKLEECAERSAVREDEAQTWINRWQAGEVLLQEMTSHLKLIGRPAVAPLADALFESLDDRTFVDAALNVLGSIRSPVSARILAHLVSEPMLEEDLETKAYKLVHDSWPLARHYILYNLRPHGHEDIPIRWFQLLVDCDDAAAVDRILEEIVVHSHDPSFSEDLLSLVDLLRAARDPEVEMKALELMNTPETPKEAIQLLGEFIRTFKPQTAKSSTNHFKAINRKYLAAARLYDAGRKPEALHKLNELLTQEPRYPFALMLKRMI